MAWDVKAADMIKQLLGDNQAVAHRAKDVFPAAEAAGCEAILTRDAAGFADSPVPGVEPALWLALLEAEAAGNPDSEVHEPGAQTLPRRRVGQRPTRPR